MATHKIVMLFSKLQEDSSERSSINWHLAQRRCVNILNEHKFYWCPCQISPRFLPTCLFVCLSVSPCPSVRQPFRLSVLPSVCPSFHLSVRPSVCLPACLSVCLFLRLSVRPSACLPVCLSVRLSFRPSVCLFIIFV
jgi:hypothetical protein